MATALPTPRGRCARCGKASRSAASNIECVHCGGMIRSALQPSDWIKCPRCEATGWAGTQRCQDCQGVGWHYARK
jgi:hypothetical protein